MFNSDITWDIDDPGHFFKHPSQWGPKSTTCGGYLTGKLSLSSDVIPQVEGKTRRLLISVTPDYREDDQEMVRRELGDRFLNIHPAIIKVVRTKEGGRRGDIEPWPNIQHGVQEFSIRKEDGKLLLSICNKTSGEDKDRDIPDEDFVFELKEVDGTVTVKLGDGKDELRLCILIPKIGNKKGELNICSTLESRLSGEDVTGERFKKLSGIFDGVGNTFNRHKVRLMAEVLESDQLLGSGFSRGIQHTADISVGTIEVSEALPCFSSDKGGNKVIMVSEFKNWHKSAVPYFSLVNKDGLRIAEDAFKDKCDTCDSCPGFLVQPKKEDVCNDGKSLTFFTPAQHHIEDWKKEGLELYLQVKRQAAPKVEAAISLKRFHFHYVSHARIPPDLQMCFHNDTSDENRSGIMSKDIHGITGGLPKQTGPGLKRRVLCKEKPKAKVFVGTETGVEEPKAALANSNREELDEGTDYQTSEHPSMQPVQLTQELLPNERAVPNIDISFDPFSSTPSSSSRSVANKHQQQPSSEAWMNIETTDGDLYLNQEAVGNLAERSIGPSPMLENDDKGMFDQFYMKMVNVYRRLEPSRYWRGFRWALMDCQQRFVLSSH